MKLPHLPALLISETERCNRKKIQTVNPHSGLTLKLAKCLHKHQQPHSTKCPCTDEKSCHLSLKRVTSPKKKKKKNYARPTFKFIRNRLLPRRNRRSLVLESPSNTWACTPYFLHTYKAPRRMGKRVTQHMRAADRALTPPTIVIRDARTDKEIL